MTRLSKIARLRKSAGAKYGKMRDGITESQVKKLAEILGENDVFVQRWTGIIRGTPIAIRKLRNMARAKTRETKVVVGAPITVKLGASVDYSFNAMPTDLAAARYFPKIRSIK